MNKVLIKEHGSIYFYVALYIQPCQTLLAVCSHALINCMSLGHVVALYITVVAFNGPGPN